MKAIVVPAVLAASFLLSAAAHAQGRDLPVPAEFPPASFTGAQYVDSTGCAFIRAGFDGSVNWVPRVDRNRRPVCGLTPSLRGGGQQMAAAPEPAPAPAAQPATPRRAEVQQPRRTTRQVQVQPAPAPEIVIAPAPQETRRVVSGPATHCPNYDAVGQQWTRATPPSRVRCGPQRIHPVDGQQTWGPGGRVWQGDAAAVPEGYRPAWRDDRLNPNRGRGTAAGDAQMRTVLTETVPMQEAAPAPAAATLSTRNATVRPATGAERFVQVGSFAVAGNAHATATRFQAMGLPVRMVNTRRGGQSLSVVQIGPVAGDAEVARALSAARGAGFGDAFVLR